MRVEEASSSTLALESDEAGTKLDIPPRHGKKEGPQLAPRPLVVKSDPSLGRQTESPMPSHPSTEGRASVFPLPGYMPKASSLRSWLGRAAQSRIKRAAMRQDE